MSIINNLLELQLLGLLLWNSSSIQLFDSEASDELSSNIIFNNLKNIGNWGSVRVKVTLEQNMFIWVVYGRAEWGDRNKRHNRIDSEHLYNNGSKYVSIQPEAFLLSKQIVTSEKCIIFLKISWIGVNSEKNIILYIF